MNASCLDIGFKYNKLIGSWALGTNKPSLKPSTIPDLVSNSVPLFVCALNRDEMKS